MGRYGFIHGKVDIKLLVLYITSRAAAPLDFATLTDLTMCDEGVDYFLFTEAVAELVETEHLTFTDGHYAITEKGRRNGSTLESHLPYAVQVRCDRNLARINAALRRNAQVRAQVLPREDGCVTLRLSLDDEDGNLLTVELLSPSEEQAARLGERFRACPEEIYNGVLSLLQRGPEEG